MVDHIEIKGAKAHNLKNIDVNIPLGRIVVISGVSGSGKSSLALGVIYAEGSRRYLDSLSTYTRRRMSFASKADVDEILHVPAAIAMHQRPSVPGLRSTFGTGTELLNSLRLMFSRLASHECPNGHHAPPSLSVAEEQEIFCPVCGIGFHGQGAEELAFNSQGACPRCDGIGSIQTVNMDAIVPDDTLTIDEGAVASWQSLMWSLMKDIARDMGIRTDVPFRDLTEKEKDLVFHGPAVKKHMVYQSKDGRSGEMDFTYFNALYTVENALSKVKDEKGMKRVAKFLKSATCPECNGTRLSPKARSPVIMGVHLDEACKMTLIDLVEWVRNVPPSLPMEMRKMAESICDSFLENAARLLDLGLGYLTLDRAASTLSNGERQRMQLARAVRNRTTGVLYVLDEPSIGLHPDNIRGLIGVMNDLITDGNSILLVDHDTDVLEAADWIIEMGPGAGSNGGSIIGEGTVEQIHAGSDSKIGPFLLSDERMQIRHRIEKGLLFESGTISLKTNRIHTVKPLKVEIPKGRMTVITGVSGSGKTTLVLECLIPAIEAMGKGAKLPPQVESIDAEGIEHIKLIDATPIGINVRSTLATYANVHDDLRKLYAKLPESKEKGYSASDFSYNTGGLRCRVCDGTGEIDLDVQFLPDVTIPCPECDGSRYVRDAYSIKREIKGTDESYSLPELMNMDVSSVLKKCKDLKSVSSKLQTLEDLGLGYLLLGEDTPSLSGGEAQRLKLANEMGKGQSDTIFVFDEPTIGLHPLDIQTLLHVFDELVKSGATLIVIEHDLDVISNADYIIDMGPYGGELGGKVVCSGTLEDIRQCEDSITARYL